MSTESLDLGYLRYLATMAAHKSLSPSMHRLGMDTLTLIAEVERLQGALDDVRELTQRAFETLHAPYTLTPFDLGHIDRDLREIERILASLDADHTDTKEQTSE